MPRLTSNVQLSYLKSALYKLKVAETCQTRNMIQNERAKTPKNRFGCVNSEWITSWSWIPTLESAADETTTYWDPWPVSNPCSVLSKMVDPSPVSSSSSGCSENWRLMYWVVVVAWPLPSSPALFSSAMPPSKNGNSDVIWCQWKLTKNGIHPLLGG